MEDELLHYGITGQKWGVRRFQNPDGSLTAAGKRRYGIAQKRLGQREAYLDRTFEITKASSRLGTTRNIISATQKGKLLSDAKAINDIIRDDDKKMVKLGQATLKQRVAILSTGGAVTTAGIIAGAALNPALFAVPVVAVTGTNLAYRLTTR